MRTDFIFKGLMVPVFTPFHDDKIRTINYEVIDKYASFLKTKGIDGVMVNGYTGEGMTLTVDERKLLTEEWFKVTRKYELKMLLNIGGLPLPYIYELAEHAEKLKVDAVMVLPDLFYHPYTEEDLVLYLKDIALYMPTRPLLYYHIPLLTKVRIDLFRFVDLIEKEVKLFTGIYYVEDKLDRIVHLKVKKPDFLYIIGVVTSLTGFKIEGFEAFSMTVMNLYPEKIREWFDYIKDVRITEMFTLHDKMTKLIYDLFVWDKKLDFITIFKLEWNKLYPTLKMGPVRMPKMSMRLFVDEGYIF